MKKFLVLGLILAVAGGAFAQSITFSGGVATGLGIIFPDRDMIPNNALVTMQRDTFGGNSLEANLNVLGTNADGTVTFHFGLRASNTIVRTTDDTTNAVQFEFKMENGNVRFNFLDNTLQLIIGRGGPGGFSTGAPRGQSFDIAEGGGGHISAVYNVTPELRFGLTLRPGYHNIGNYTTAAGNRLRRVPISLGVRYAIPDVGSLHLNFLTNGTADDKQRMDLAVGANLAALVSGTSFTALNFSVAILDLTKTSNTMTFELSEGITFAQDALTIQAMLRQTVAMPTGGTMRMNLHFRVNATYKINDIVTPGLDLGFVMGNDATNLGTGINAGNLVNLYRRPTDALGQAAVGRLQDRMGVAINPYVNFVVGPSTTMQLGYTFARNLKGASFMTNAVYFNVGMSF